jgi:hypothetical protein
LEGQGFRKSGGYTENSETKLGTIEWIRRISSMKRYMSRMMSFCVMSFLLLPALAFGAGGPASMLVVVADTRRVDGGIERYFANLYNTNILLFAIWAVVLTAAWGAILGVIMDFIMSRTGLDLKSRKIIEH